MGFNLLVNSFPWHRYSNKLKTLIEKPRNGGFFTQEEATKRGMRLVTGEEGTLSDGNYIKFYWLVDESDGTLIDAKYQLFGQTALIGAAELLCQLIVGKNYDQVRRIGAELVDKQARDKAQHPSFPSETYPHLNLALGAIDQAADQCDGIPLPERYVAPPAPQHFGEVLKDGIPGFLQKSKDEKIGLIEEVLNAEVRPYIALDGGGIEVLDLVDEKKLLIAYQGNCTSCFSSMGATLGYIQQVLSSRVHPDIEVVPEL